MSIPRTLLPNIDPVQHLEYMVPEAKHLTCTFVICSVLATTAPSLSVRLAIGDSAEAEMMPAGSAGD